MLVLGAGGGLELRALANMRPDWRFKGADPSPEMLEQARIALGAVAACVELHECYIEDAPAGPFDGATCLLTLHFLPEQERLRTLRELHHRLRPGAPLIVVHHSFPTSGTQHDRWLARNAAYSVASGVPADETQQSLAAMKFVRSPSEGSRTMTRSPAQHGTAEVIRDKRRQRSILVATCAALMAVIASVSGLNVAQQEVAIEFSASQTTVLWIFNAYTIALAAMLLPIGAVGDRWGRRPVLPAGLALFVVASLMTA